MAKNPRYQFPEVLQNDFSRLFKEWYAPICYFADSLLKDAKTAEDVATDAFIRLWENHEQFKNSLSCKAFLYKVVRNRCLNLLRHKKVEQVYINAQGLNKGFDKTVFDRLIETELAEKLARALQQLPPKCHEIVKMVYWEGKTSSEIAEQLNLSVHTVKEHRKKGARHA